MPPVIREAPPGELNVYRVYYTFLILLLVTLIAGVVLLALWWFMHTTTRTLVANIKSQMPPNPAIQEGSGEAPSTEG